MQELYSAAQKVKENAYAPYSGFSVGAAVRGASGRIYVGCNVENAAYPLGSCAEASAVCALISDGETRIKEMLVVSDGEDLCPPCGGCRQIIREFADGDVRVHLCGNNGVRRTVTVDELLPMPFHLDSMS